MQDLKVKTDTVIDLMDTKDDQTIVKHEKKMKKVKKDKKEKKKDKESSNWSIFVKIDVFFTYEI